MFDPIAFKDPPGSTCAPIAQIAQIREGLGVDELGNREIRKRDSGTQK
jgi:hypothetical protein